MTIGRENSIWNDHEGAPDPIVLSTTTFVDPSASWPFDEPDKSIAKRAGYRVPTSGGGGSFLSQKVNNRSRIGGRHAILG